MTAYIICNHFNKSLF